MKYKIVALLALLLFTQSLYSQDKLRIYVGHSIKGDFDPMIRRFDILTFDLKKDTFYISNILDSKLFDRRRFSTTDNLPIYNDETLSFGYTIGGDSCVFIFEKSKNLITQTIQSYRWDGTKADSLRRAVTDGFTQQQIDNPTNELENQYSRMFKPFFVKANFYEKLDHPWGNEPSYQLRRKGYFNRDSVEKVIYLYNSQPELDSIDYLKLVNDTLFTRKENLTLRRDLISHIKSKWKVEVDSIPVDLIKILGNSKPMMNQRDRERKISWNLSELQDSQKVVLEYHYHPESGKGDIGYYSSTKEWFESYETYGFGGSLFKILGKDLEFDYNVFEKLYKIRWGIDRYQEYRINSNVVVDTNVVVRVSEEVIDTVGWTRSNSELEVLIVKKEKGEFDKVSKEEYEKNKSKYLKRGYKLYWLISFSSLPYDPRHIPGSPSNGDYYDERLIVIRKKKSVWLNDVYIGTCLIHETFDRSRIFN